MDERSDTMKTNIENHEKKEETRVEKYKPESIFSSLFYDGIHFLCVILLVVSLNAGFFLGFLAILQYNLNELQECLKYLSFSSASFIGAIICVYFMKQLQKEGPKEEKEEEKKEPEKKEEK